MLAHPTVARSPYSILHLLQECRSLDYSEHVVSSIRGPASISVHHAAPNNVKQISHSRSKRRTEAESRASSAKQCLVWQKKITLFLACSRFTILLLRVKGNEKISANSPSHQIFGIPENLRMTLVEQKKWINLLSWYLTWYYRDRVSSCNIHMQSNKMHIFYDWVLFITYVGSIFSDLTGPSSGAFV